MKLYSIKNAQTELYNPPFVARDDVDAKEMVRKAVIGGRDVSLLVELDNLVLYVVGYFDPENGCLTENLGIVQFLCDMLLPVHIQNMIDKLKEVKE